jgi:hypothetical protein
MKSTSYFVFNYFVFLCLNLYSVNLHNSLRTCSIGVEPHLGLMTRYLLLFDSYGLVFVGGPSLTRGRVCLFYMLLALANAVILGSESQETRHHILLPQIWDFPFRRVLRLAGLRWRYSTPPPQTPHGPYRKHKSRGCYLVSPLARWLLPSNEL